MSQNIRTYWGSSHEYGGCNACNRYFVNGRPRKHQVLNIDFLAKALSFRLCTECVQSLKEQITKVPERQHCGLLMRYESISNGDVFNGQQLTGTYYCLRCSTMQPTYTKIDEGN